MCLYRASQKKIPDKFTSLEQLQIEGKELIREKEYRRALPLYEQATIMAPQDWRILDVLGFLCYMTGSYEKAVEYCERSLQIKPHNPYALKGLGLCLVEMNRSEDGIALIRRAIQINPEVFDAHYDLAVVYMKTKQYARARKHLKRALTIDPNRSREVNRALARLDRLSSPSV
jgi:tetratricopeptide (TPR) repeat protein